MLEEAGSPVEEFAVQAHWVMVLGGLDLCARVCVSE